MKMRSAVGLLVLGLVLSGCSFTFRAVNPRPNVAVAKNAGTFAIDVTAVQDRQQLPQVEILEFQRTLTTGFQNAVGSHLSTPPQSPGMRLVIDRADLEFANLGTMGRFLTVRYRAKWVNAVGEEVAEVAGMAKPRNPTETGPRHLEDVVEVMMEELIGGLDRINNKNSSSGPAALN